MWIASTPDFRYPWLVSDPHAVVIPFGVPEHLRGVGIGLAALVHSFARIDGRSVALAQLFTRPGAESAEGAKPAEPARPIEAFVPPNAWRDLSNDGKSDGVQLVLTGAFDPPQASDRGTLQLLAFDAQSGATRAMVEIHLDADAAGRGVCEAFDALWSKVGGELGHARDIADLDWDALESVLMAERCALHDPSRGGPHDRLAALAHLGRAVGDAPDALFPAGRLAALALDTAIEADEPRLEEAALRAILRAVEDAPARTELGEAAAALEMRLGRHTGAEKRLERMAEGAGPRAIALLSEAKRAQGNVDGARAVLEAGFLRFDADPILLVERGFVSLAASEPEAAKTAWRQVMEAHGPIPGAFAHLAALALQHGDAGTGSWMVDMALAASDLPPPTLRQALHVCAALEPDGIHRATRISKLGRALTERVPQDARAHLITARALNQMGDRDTALFHLDRAEELAPNSTLGAEAQRGRFSVEHPDASAEIEALLRAANEAREADLGTIAVRAHKFALLYENLWTPHLAMGVAEARGGRPRSAAKAFENATRCAPGCVAAWVELSRARVALGDIEGGIVAAERAQTLDPESLPVMAVSAEAYLAAQRHDEAAALVRRALEHDGTNHAFRALRDRIEESRIGAERPLARLFGALRRWRER